MIQVQSSEGLRTLPKNNTWWRNKDSGEVYLVTHCSNLSDRQRKFPTMVNYIGPNNRQWSKAATEWYDSFEPLTQVLVNKLEAYAGRVIDAEVLADLLATVDKLMEQSGEDGRDYR